jgi:hypothetical protein
MRGCAVVVDTNVAVVSNGKTPQASLDCVEACIAKLVDIRNRRKVLVDQSGLILDEYRRNLRPSGQPGPGDAFFKWLWDNQGQPRHCQQVEITPQDGDGESFAEFPDDPALAGFDRADRKFVATALASGEGPPILNASDTDWWKFRAALKGHGVKVHFLCPELMKRKR